MTTSKSTPRRDVLAALTAVVAPSVISVAASPAAAQCQGIKFYGGEEESFGDEVAIDAAGEVVVVGVLYHDGPATPDAGVAYAFFREESLWSSATEIVPADSEDHDYFGRAVSLSADGLTMLIGAPSDDSDGLNQGAGYVYIWNGSEWVYQIQLFSPDSTHNDEYGDSVALSADGNIAVIGARLGNSAYIFARTGSTWSFQQKLVPARGIIGFGATLAISASGQVIVVGDPAADGAGAVHVFTHSGASWEHLQTLVEKEPKPNGQFGKDLSISADAARLLIGTLNYFGQEPGAAYVFEHDGRTWKQTSELSSPDSVGGNWFGSAVALQGDMALIGSPRVHARCPCVSDPYETGAAYLYQLQRGEWTLIQKLFAADASFNARFGSDVALGGAYAMISATNASKATPEPDAVYVFNLADLCRTVVDINFDGFVNGFDLGILLGSWSSPPGSPACGGTVCCPSDLNDDCTVNSLDLAILLGSWG